MSHHLRGTSDAFAENVFINGREKARKLRAMAASVNLLRASSSGVGQRWSRGRFMEIMKPLASFLPLLFAANLDLLPGDSDKVTGTTIIREINIARQNPTLYANFLEQIRQNYARSGSPDAGQTPRAHSGGCRCSG